MWSGQHDIFVEMSDSEKGETSTKRWTSVCVSSTLFCWRFRLNTHSPRRRRLLLFIVQYICAHTISSPHIHWPPYQLYEHACDYYYLKCCNRDDNCWTNKHTQTLPDRISRWQNKTSLHTLDTQRRERERKRCVLANNNCQNSVNKRNQIDKSHNVILRWLSSFLVSDHSFWRGGGVGGPRF